MFSYDVEASRGDIHNLVIVVMNEQELSLQEAIDFVGDLCKSTMDTFEQVRHSLPSWGPEIDAQVQKYVGGLQDWIIGSLHWSFATPRYFGEKGQEVKNQLIVKISPRISEH